MGMTKGQQKQRGLLPDNEKLKSQQQQQKKAARPQVIHGDLYARANFTFQASAFLQQLHSQSGLDAKRQASSDGVEENQGPPREQDCPDLSRLSRNIMTANGKMVIHNQMKLDPSMKRNICEKCSTVLIPGLTSRVRNRPSKAHFNVTHTSCLSCDTRRTIPCPPTSLGEDGLDGRKRSARRAKQAKRAKIPFYNREASATNPAGQGSQPAQKGHSLWRGDKTIENWGETANTEDTDTTPTET